MSPCAYHQGESRRKASIIKTDGKHTPCHVCGTDNTVGEAAALKTVPQIMQQKHRTWG